MLKTKDSERALTRLMNRRFEMLPLDCGNETTPGTDESPAHRDWSLRPTTLDQARIEKFIAPRLQPDSRILHVGIGNSGLARRFSGKVSEICGITISGREFDHAKSLGLPGYRPLLINKYSRAYVALADKFDFIIDNNPSTFACCRAHFWRMMVASRDKLRPGGMIATDKGGLAHLASDAPQLERWRFSPLDWLAVAQALGLKARREGNFVLTMRAG